MSSVKIQGNASGTGIFTIASPNSNNTQTLTLPDATTTLVGASSAQAAQAWVNFTGATGTVNRSYNVTSVTRNSTGNYTIAFTSALANANYSCVIVASNVSAVPSKQPQVTYTSRSTGSLQYVVYDYGAGGVMDCTYNDVAIFC